MNTSKSISTIHYINPSALIVRLDDLIQKNKISFYAFIEHHKEEDEKKDHIHLFIIPNGKINTDQLRDFLEFLDPKDPTKPIRSLPFQNSKFGDWYLYCKHDSAYLLSKQQSRKFHYEDSDFYVSDFDYFRELIHQIDFTKFRTQKVVLDMINSGKTFPEILQSGIVPITLIHQYRTFFETMESVIRTSYTHDNFDPDTGELISNENEE